MPPFLGQSRLTATNRIDFSPINRLVAQVEERRRHDASVARNERRYADGQARLDRREADAREQRRVAGLKSRVGGLALLGMRETDPTRQAAVWDRIKSIHPQADTLGDAYADPRSALALVAAESGQLDTLLDQQNADRRHAFAQQQHAAQMERHRTDAAFREAEAGRASERHAADMEFRRQRLAMEQLRSRAPSAAEEKERRAAEAARREQLEKAGNLRQGIENLNAATGMIGFDSAVGPIQGGEASMLGMIPRVVNDTLANGAQREIRAKIEGDTRALSAAIKPLIRKPGEGTFTDADQRQLDFILGDLSDAANTDEFRRRLGAVRDRIEANFGVDIGRLSFESAPKETSRLPAGWSVERLD
ncbi:MAG: hypothetical protein AAFQ35_07130 [Pseudomonadota bacterium]